MRKTVAMQQELKGLVDHYSKLLRSVSALRPLKGLARLVSRVFEQRVNTAAHACMHIIRPAEFNCII